LLEHLPPYPDGHPFSLILCSAHESYRKEAAQLGAVDYLAKPYTIGQLLRAINAAREQVMMRRAAQAYHELFPLPHSSTCGAETIVVIMPPCPKKQRTCAVEYIVAVCADGEWSRVLYREGNAAIVEIVDKRPLGYWDNVLAKHLPDQAMRVHDATTVNLVQVVDWRHYKKKDAMARLSNGQEVRVSRTRKKMFCERWAQMRQRVLFAELFATAADTD
jgi:DNA-binding LytR/AlgR family response regulator